MTLKNETPQARERRLAYNRTYKATHREQFLAYEQKYREQHKEELRVKAKVYYATHREELLIRQQEHYYATHANARQRRMQASLTPEETREHLRMRCRAYYQRNREKILRRNNVYFRAHSGILRVKRHAHYLAHRVRIRARGEAYRRAHPEVNRASVQRHRARKRGAKLSNLTHAQWLEIQAAQDHRCYYCEKRCKGRLTQDHITPVSSGGAHTLHNVIGACLSCNSHKHAGPPLRPVQPLLLTLAPAKVPRRRTAPSVEPDREAGAAD